MVITDKDKVEMLYGDLKAILAEWRIKEWDIDRPPKEVAPKDGFRRFECGGDMKITVWLEKGVTDTGT